MGDLVRIQKAPKIGGHVRLPKEPELELELPSLPDRGEMRHLLEMMRKHPVGPEAAVIAEFHSDAEYWMRFAAPDHLTRKNTVLASHQRDQALRGLRSDIPLYVVYRGDLSRGSYLGWGNSDRYHDFVHYVTVLYGIFTDVRKVALP